MFSQNFSIIGVAVRELHLLEVEGVELSFFAQIWSKYIVVLRHNS
jgi:hypothetical protein